MEFLNIDGKDYPICVDFSILKLIKKKFGTNLSEVQGILEDAEKLDYIFYHSLKRGYEVSKEKFELTEQQTTDILCGPHVVGDFLVMFASALTVSFTTSKKSEV
jgi:hypothetical protein